MNNTDLLYLQDTYLFTETASVLEVGNNEFGEYIILSKTIFYPQGGGQPSDRGIISSGESIFQVHKCMLSPEGVVYHYGEYSSGTLSIGQNVDLQIDADYRISNAKNHSAGHLVDVAMHILGYDRSLQAGKGFHFPVGSYVEYSGELPENLEIMREALEKQFQELSQKDIPINISYDGLGELEVPTGKSPRWVEFEGYVGCGCGGTHVKNSSEIGRVSVRKMKYKKGVLKVSYCIKQT